MKDMYTFDSSLEDAQQTYSAAQAAYSRILQRIGVDFRVVEADTGLIGGSESHEYHVVADTGEDVLLSCTSCAYAANAEKARGRVRLYSTC